VVVDKKVTIIIVALVMLVFLLLCVVAGGAFWWYKTERDREISGLEKRLKTAENNLGKTAGDDPKKTPVDQYDGWLTYTNTQLGYTLRYPPDWKAEEHTGVEIDMPSNYVTFGSPDGNYSVTFGMRPTGADTFISGRTGLGQGEPTESGTITIQGNTYPKVLHLLDGKAKVIWFGGSSYWTVDGNEAYAELGAPGLGYMTLDLKGVPEEVTAEKIVSSLKLK